MFDYENILEPLLVNIISVGSTTKKIRLYGGYMVLLGGIGC